MRHRADSGKSLDEFPLISAGPQISAAPLGIYIEIRDSPLISDAPLNARLLE